MQVLRRIMTPNDSRNGNSFASTLLMLGSSLRVQQWTKNLVVFAALVFSRNLLEVVMLAKVVAACAVFSLLSGATYILNDLADLKQDQHHPTKRRRPLASGRLRVAHAFLTMSVLVVLCLAAARFLGVGIFLVCVSYFFLQVAYSFLLKQVVILDVFAVAAGFVLRVLAGALVIEVAISSWLIICTVLLSLFLALSKRRHELILIGDQADDHRRVLAEYTPYLLDQMISVVTASTVMAYALYTVSPETVEKFGTRNLVFTVPFVLYGVLRYLYLVHQKGKGGRPEKVLFMDPALLIDVALWVIVAGAIIYRQALR